MATQLPCPTCGCQSYPCAAEGLKAGILRVGLEANAEIYRIKRLLDDTVHALYEATNALTVIEQTRGLAHPLTPPDMIERQNAAMAELHRLIAQGRAAIAKAMPGGTQ